MLGRLEPDAAAVLIELGAVYTGREIKHLSQCVRAPLAACPLQGEQVLLQVELELEVTSEPEAIELTIVHEDDHLLVLNKPAGLVVHPGAGNPQGTLLNALLHHDAKLAAQACHRLDQFTTGVLLLSRTKEANRKLKRAMQAREMSKTY
ncbi:MAG: hypothetical protein WDW38_005331 [Sanguina aurantia]